MIKRFLVFARGALIRLGHYRKLRNAGFTAKFLHEGNVAVQLPHVSWLEAFLGRSKNASRNINFYLRPSAEILLRSLVHRLYLDEIIPANKSIIDIGSWIGDNSVVWAKMLNSNAQVFAIDPSPENNSYGRHLSELNEIKNIQFIEAVCTDSDGEMLGFDGDLDHTDFQKNPTECKITATTLDIIINEAGRPSIGFVHVDVEGLELPVLIGASQIIDRDRPIISFEQHISREDVGMVKEFLFSFDYRVFMVNEVLPGCDLDCRNFLAFPNGTALLNWVSDVEEIGSNSGIFKATIGSSLIEI